MYIKFVQINKEKLTTMSTKEVIKGIQKEPDYDEDENQLEEKQEKETRETRNNKSSFLNYGYLCLDCYILKYIGYVNNRN